jgi:hypothetical protein
MSPSPLLLVRLRLLLCGVPSPPLPALLAVLLAPLALLLNGNAALMVSGMLLL